jgi:hypothetical protein
VRRAPLHQLGVGAGREQDPAARRTALVTLVETAVACCAPLSAPVLDEDEAVATAALFKALADPARVRIVNALATSPEPVCACEFEPALGLSQPTVSRSSPTRDCSSASSADAGRTSR